MALFDAGPRHSLIVHELCSCADATHRPPPPDCPCREGLVCASSRVHASRSRVLAFATRACSRARVLVCSHLPRVCCSRVLAFATRESLACARARVGQHLLRGCGWSLPVCDTATPVRSKSLGTCSSGTVTREPSGGRILFGRALCATDPGPASPASGTKSGSQFFDRPCLSTAARMIRFSMEIPPASSSSSPTSPRVCRPRSSRIAFSSAR